MVNCSEVVCWIRFWDIKMKIGEEIRKFRMVFRMLLVVSIRYYLFDLD